ncbi:uncharacterized protein LOC119656873 isoform X3 [Hermetia illucens]|uniref:uncharacterized protein LOC119656873 isoform X3 n=1 Tax=Hermetia illucens TaxID=343691 RepID=UPI0018CC1117|nr:uncharacterized protein LOC119656873 isoform X3 [Hermetia illucens]
MLCYRNKLQKFNELNSLLICICFWLLILQKARAMPVTRTCEEYKEAIRAVIDQAKMSYHVNYGILEDFTQKYFRQTHTAVNETWHHKKFDSLKPATHTARQKEPDSYMKTDSGSLKHLMDGFTKKMVSEELQQLHEQLQILESAFQFVSEESNKVDEYDPAIYDSHLGYVRMLKEELGDSMDKLEIPKVDFAAPNLNDNCSKEVRDFILMREHLTVLRYLLDAFEILHSACPVDSC